MIFYLHYILLTSGLSGTSVLLAVYFKTYSDASQGEAGALLMAIPFVCLFVKLIVCSMADRHQAHHLYLMLALMVMMVGFAPFLVIPFFPAFYEAYARYSWYLLMVSCLVGQGGLAVAWSLGDCLAINNAQRTGTPFGHMRLMGTLSWGIYGFIIGQINEHPSLPKFIPAFIILQTSVFLELVLLFFWNKRSFEMFDPLANQELTLTPNDKHQQASQTNVSTISYNNGNGNGNNFNFNPNSSRDDNDQYDKEVELMKMRNKQIDSLVNSVPSSLGGTLKMDPKAAKKLFEMFTANDDELIRRLKVVEQEEQDSGQEDATENNTNANKQNNSAVLVPVQVDQQPPIAPATIKGKPPTMNQILELRNMTENGKFSNGTKTKTETSNEDQLEKGSEPQFVATTKTNTQLILLKLIIVEDGRVLKYIILFTAFGLFMAPMNFFFVSVQILCQKRGYDFSQLAGAVLMSQALIETLTFLVTPKLLSHLARWSLMSFGFVILGMKYAFYTGWYYNDDVSPYWAVVSEWSHGIAYGMFCLILADVSLMFANQSRLFIPELRQLGLLTAETGSNKQVIEAEERAIKMSLRATMQAMFNGFMDGLGIGVGSLLCGVISDLYSYQTVWFILGSLAFAICIVYLIAELSKSRWSDSFKPLKGTKAHEIMELSRASDEAHRRSVSEAKRAKSLSGASRSAAGQVVAKQQQGENNC